MILRDISVKRQGFRRRIFLAGQLAGEIHGSKQGWVLYIGGVYWKGDCPNRHGGASGHAFKTLTAAICVAVQILSTEEMKQ